MRRIRHLEQCDYVIAIGQKISQVLSLSGQSNCYLERTWDQAKEENYNLDINVKFNSSAMQGLNIIAELKRNDKICSCVISSIAVYRVSDGSFAKTLIGSFSPTLSGQSWALNLTQAQLGLNELSGAETYYVEATASRRVRSYKSGVYVNHLGCFDSINRLRKSSEFLQITKLDE